MNPWEYLKELANYIGYIGTIAGAIAVLIKFWREQTKSKAGQLCLLRAEMLKIYYKNKDTETIRQYEAELFVMMYDAYKARGGNSFIDEVNENVRKWKLIQ